MTDIELSIENFAFLIDSKDEDRVKAIIEKGASFKVCTVYGEGRRERGGGDGNVRGGEMEAGPEL
eukprot:1346431-Amorphochlora_amoeboformis.AAC.1